MQGETAVLAQLSAVRKRYGQIPALDGVDLDLRPGEVLALLGANGAGKSTAIGLLLGLLSADSGSAALFGQSPQSLAARRRIGVMLQSAGIPEASKVGELLELTRSYYPDPRSVADCVALAGLDGLLDRRYGRLSGGQQRRVQFALAVCGRPQLLFLDEPTTGLDIEARQGLWRAIRELVAQGSSVLLTTHYLEEAEALADRVVVLHRGRVVAAGSMGEVRAHVSQRRIRCVTTLDADTVAGWAQVRSARRDGERIEVVVTEAAESVVRRLLDLDPGLRDLEIQRAGLAEAFLELTQDARVEAPDVALQPQQEAA
ncbi:MAG: ABC transporter ATP-binding protein [Lysobacter sp.]|nr:ABC transporter ATP-binding protein [Lysobacter sp.]